MSTRALNDVPPSQQHASHPGQLLTARATFYGKCASDIPHAGRGTRDWTLANKVYLNPDRYSFKGTA